jgi:hypothetical protein
MLTTFPTICVPGVQPAGTPHARLTAPACAKCTAAKLNMPGGRTEPVARHALCTKRRRDI